MCSLTIANCARHVGWTWSFETAKEDVEETVSVSLIDTLGLQHEEDEEDVHMPAKNLEEFLQTNVALNQDVESTQEEPDADVPTSGAAVLLLRQLQCWAEVHCEAAIPKVNDILAMANAKRNKQTRIKDFF